MGLNRRHHGRQHRPDYPADVVDMLLCIHLVARGIRNGVRDASSYDSVHHTAVQARMPVGVGLFRILRSPNSVDVVMGSRREPRGRRILDDLVDHMLLPGT